MGVSGGSDRRSGRPLLGGGEGAAAPFMVGRQPIFDAGLEVYGYELLFRNGSGRVADGTGMTADVVVHAALDVGLDGLVGSKRAFVNASRPFLTGDQEIPLPPERTVIEILEDVVRDAEVVDGCRRLVEEGYTLALDDYVGIAGNEQLLELAHIIKFDISAIPAEQLGREVERCDAYEVVLLAEKVESREQLAVCRDLGFHLFQGFLLSHPEIVAGQTLTPNRATCLRLVDRLCDPDTSAAELERIVESDVGLSERFLRAAGTGAARGMRRPVRSIRDGLVLLGRRRLRSWVMLMLLADSNAGAPEQLAVAMIRARMCELLAGEVSPTEQDSAFTVGLVSALDILLCAPLQEIVAGLSITDDLVAALLEHSGRLGCILTDVVAWEVGDPGPRLRSGADHRTVERAYLEALSWANETLQVLEV